MSSHNKDRDLCLGEKLLSSFRCFGSSVYLQNCCVFWKALFKSKSCLLSSMYRANGYIEAHWLHITRRILQQYLGLTEAYSLVQRANLAVSSSSKDNVSLCTVFAWPRFASRGLQGQLLWEDARGFCHVQKSQGQPAPGAWSWPSQSKMAAMALWYLFKKQTKVIVEM